MITAYWHQLSDDIGHLRVGPGCTGWGQEFDFCLTVVGDGRAAYICGLNPNRPDTRFTFRHWDATALVLWSRGFTTYRWERIKGATESTPISGKIRVSSTFLKERNMSHVKLALDNAGHALEHAISVAHAHNETALASALEAVHTEHTKASAHALANHAGNLVDALDGLKPLAHAVNGLTAVGIGSSLPQDHEVHQAAKAAVAAMAAVATASINHLVSSMP